MSQKELEILYKLVLAIDDKVREQEARLNKLEGKNERQHTDK